MDRGIKIVRHFKEVFETYRVTFKDLKEGCGGWVKEADTITICLPKNIYK